MQNFGGYMHLNVPGYPGLVLRTNMVKIDESGLSSEGIANADGSVSVKMTPTGYMTELGDIELPPGFNIQSLLTNGYDTISIVEDTNGRLHIFNQARIVGKPVTDTSTGATSGLQIFAAAYQRANT